MKTRPHLIGLLSLLLSPALMAHQAPKVLFALNPGPVNSSTEIRCQYDGSDSDIFSIFQNAVSEMKNINGWGKSILPPGQKFQLFSTTGTPVKSAATGNFIRIYPALLLTGARQLAKELYKNSTDLDISTLKRATKLISKNYFWVQIEGVHEISPSASEPLFEMTVRPSINPLRPDQPEVIRHMFKSTATNSFTVRRSGNQILVSVVGKNEEINLSDGLNPEEKIINFLAATTAWGKREAASQEASTAGPGIQKVIWTSLLMSLLPKNASCSLDGKALFRN
ncbi:MAG: hypothetical protein K2X47_06425 [Bdellovibrionales bacterium]|nr:hypothetical protein [Bdellovibrionales bacterium]